MYFDHVLDTKGKTIFLMNMFSKYRSQEFIYDLISKTVLSKGIHYLFLPHAPKKLQFRSSPKLKKKFVDFGVLGKYL